jgi:hypothetical protein
MQPDKEKQIIVIGAGPAGLMAAETIASAGFEVHVYDGMPSAGRKFLLAGKSGMNLSHAEDQKQLLSRYLPQQRTLLDAVNAFDATAVRAWAHDLGIETFVGSSGRIFPTDMKAAPLLRAWLHRLKSIGVRFHMRHRFLRFDRARLILEHDSKELVIEPEATVFAMGGASWSRLGSDAQWVDHFRENAVTVQPFEPSNCGFEVTWSHHIKDKFAGTPLMTVMVTLNHAEGKKISRQGQFVITEHGVEGSLIYALSALIREEIKRSGIAILHLDLLPGRELAQVIEAIATSRGSRSLSSHLKSKLNLQAIHVALLYELLEHSQLQDMSLVAQTLKAYPLRLERARPIDEAISSAGGIAFSQLNESLMLRAKPGTFCAGEMLDWEAPTGGYLLTACFATGKLAGQGVINYLQQKAASINE